MLKPDRVMRNRPLTEEPEAVANLKRVVLFHPEPIAIELPSRMCVCGKDERKKGRKTKAMTQCDECLEWFHNDCAGIRDDFNAAENDWKCEWCQDVPDREGYQRWKTDRKKAKKRHIRDKPKARGAQPGGEALPQWSAPRQWEDKVAEVKELARRVAIKKRKLNEAVQQLVDERGHHMVDAEGMDGLDMRPIDDGLVDEMVGAGLVNPEDMSED
jgi:hypothetical protein